MSKVTQKKINKYYYKKRIRLQDAYPMGLWQFNDEYEGNQGQVENAK